MIAMLVIAIIALLAFDWNRVRPWINARVSDTIGRPFVIHGDLSLRWRAPQGERGWRAWIPWPQLRARDVSIGNPRWSTEPVMAHVREITFSVNPLPLLARKIVIPSLSLDGPQIYLQRLNDGRSNWTFFIDDQSRWKLNLQTLRLRNGSARVDDAIRRVRLHAEFDSLDKRSNNYQIGWRIDGSINGKPVTGHGRAGGILSLHETDSQLPVDAKIWIGNTTIDAQGRLTGPYQLASLDLQVKVAGVSMAQLYPVTGIVLPETRPFTIEGRLSGTLNSRDARWVYENFTGKMGDSEVTGTLHYRLADGKSRLRPLLEGTILSKQLNFNDLSPLISADFRASRAARGVKIAQPANKVFSVEPFRTERWASIDADVQFSSGKILRKQELLIDHLFTRMQLRDGVISLAPLKFGIGGGNVVSTIRLDGRSKPVKADVQLSARHLKLKELVPNIAEIQANISEINGDAAFTAAGHSIDGLMSNAHGDMKAAISQGTISKLLLEQMGLNIGSIVATQLFGDKQVQMHCAAGNFTINKGVIKAQAFVVDTEDATIHMDGNIDLARERLALTIYPESKGLRLISLRSPVYVTGTLKKPEVNIDKRILATKAGSAIALGMLAPAAVALLPLVDVGADEKNECGALLAQVPGKPVMRTAPAQVMETSGQ